MQINVSTRHGQLGQEARGKIIDKVGKLTRLEDRTSSVNVTVDVEHEDDPAVEIHVNVDRAHEFVATARTGTLWSSLDAAIEKIEEQLRRHKDRRKDHSKPGLKRAELAPTDLDENE